VKPSKNQQKEGLEHQAYGFSSTKKRGLTINTGVLKIKNHGFDIGNWDL
jgi:hypothetical protein